MPGQEAESAQHSRSTAWQYVKFQGPLCYLSFIHLTSVYLQAFLYQVFPRVLFCCCLFLMEFSLKHMIWGVSSGQRSRLAECLAQADAHEVAFIDKSLCNLWFQICQREQWRDSANYSAWLCIGTGESQPKAQWSCAERWFRVVVRAQALKPDCLSPSQGCVTPSCWIMGKFSTSLCLSFVLCRIGIMLPSAS